MYKSHNASRSSVDSSQQTDHDAEAQIPKNIKSEEVPSLQMLEESAAKLAALRQRAEFLLDQLSAGSSSTTDARTEVASSDEKPDSSGGSVVDEKAWEQAQDIETEASADHGRLPTVDEGPAPLDNEIQALLDVEPAFPEMGAKGRPPALQALPPQTPQKEPTVPLSRPEGDDIYDPVSPEADAVRQTQQSGDIGPLDQEDQPSAYPLQVYRPDWSMPDAQTAADDIVHKPASLLDRPIGASLSAGNRIADSGSGASSAARQIMEEEIFDLYDAINRVLETRQENTGHALSLLREASQIISANPRGFERAEYNIKQARQILDRARFSRRRSRNNGLRAVGQVILWLAALVALGAAAYFFPQEANQIVQFGAAEVGWDTVHIFPSFWAALIGGVAGCLGTISFLLEQMRSDQDFDGQYIVRSRIQPLMGVILGALVYVLSAVLFNSLGSSITVHRVTAYLPAAIAFPIGLWQEYVYALIFRFTRLFTFQRRRRW